MHPGAATIPAKAACAADKQGKFAEMEKLIWEKGFNAGRDLSQGNMEKIAGEIGLNIDRLKADMEGECAKIIQKDHSELQAFGVTGTPGFFINGRFLRGAQPYEAFKRVVDEELKKANERVSQGTSVADYYNEWVIKKGEKKL